MSTAFEMANHFLIVILHPLVKAYAADADLLPLIPEDRICKSLSKGELDQVLERPQLATPPRV
jgi:hypothetical protein